MSDVIHATMRGLDTIRRRLKGQIEANGLVLVTACDRVSVLDADRFFADTDALELLNGMMPLDWPTCPHCLVLLDEALERSGDPL